MKKKPKIMVFLPAYNCEPYIYKVLGDIPDKAYKRVSEIVVVDDHSKDKTSQKAKDFIKKNKSKGKKITVVRNKKNLGYGGVQKKMYNYGIKKKYDYAIMMHGDGQAIAKDMLLFIDEIDKSQPGFVSGTRMLSKESQGGMPFHKIVGNRALTLLENTILGTSLSEFHCGFRAWRLDCLEKLPFNECSDNYHFDSEIIFQYALLKESIKEVGVSTVYEDQVSGFNSFTYGTNILKSLGEFVLSKYKIKKSKKYTLVEM